MTQNSRHGSWERRTGRILLNYFRSNAAFLTLVATGQGPQIPQDLANNINNLMFIGPANDPNLNP
jgi:hypothetical protein